MVVQNSGMKGGGPTAWLVFAPIVWFAAGSPAETSNSAVLIQEPGAWQQMKGDKTYLFIIIYSILHLPLMPKWVAGAAA